MKHYGIWLADQSEWLIDVNGMIFWTSSRIVAEEQLKAFRLPIKFDALVREFEEKIAAKDRK
jgi:hypothetical protein